MEEENKVSEEQQQQTEQQQQPVEQQVEVATEVEKPKKTRDENWERASQVMAFQKRKIEELEQKYAEISQVKSQPEVDEFASLDPEEYMTVSKARQMAEKLAEKKAKEIARSTVNEYAQQQRLESDEQRMRTKAEDYDYVVDNFAVEMIKQDPALAYYINRSKNPAETAYKLAKQSDAYNRSLEENQGQQKAEKILKNSSRPVSSHAVGTPLKAQVDYISTKSKAQIWEESQKYAKGVV